MNDLQKKGLEKKKKRIYRYTTQWAKSPKKQFEGVRFFKFGTQNTCCRKHTPTDCFFGDVAHWVKVDFCPFGYRNGKMENA